MLQSQSPFELPVSRRISEFSPNTRTVPVRCHFVLCDSSKHPRGAINTSNPRAPLFLYSTDGFNIDTILSKIHAVRRSFVTEVKHNYSFVYAYIIFTESQVMDRLATEPIMLSLWFDINERCRTELRDYMARHYVSVCLLHPMICYL